MAFPAALDELAAVNIMLGVIGQSPVATLSGSLTADISMAVSVLDEVSRMVQSAGWEFNTETDVTYTPTPVMHNVTVADDILRFDVPGRDLSQRGVKVWDKKENSFDLGEGDLNATVIRALEFNDMPPVGRYYVSVKAARVFQKRVLGSESLDQFTAEDEASAYQNLLDAESQNADYNIFDHPDVGSIVYPRRFGS